VGAPCRGRPAAWARAPEAAAQARGPAPPSPALSLPRALAVSPPPGRPLSSPRHPCRPGADASSQAHAGRGRLCAAVGFAGGQHDDADAGREPGRHGHVVGAGGQPVRPGWGRGQPPGQGRSGESARPDSVWAWAPPPRRRSRALDILSAAPLPISGHPGRRRHNRPPLPRARPAPDPSRATGRRVCVCG
jgi:hypothetical protein